mmetsp:Transcript_51010/g.114695  ORF Transcript_51010/g.114695 Transcript_51010/m.114695 type:complete len:218 (-) Transcript_51010:327-980(-)
MRRLKVPREEHVHALEDVLRAGASDRKDSFVTEEVVGLCEHDLADPHLQLHVVELSLKTHAHRADRGVVLVVPLRVQKLRVHLHHTLDVEGADVQELRGVSLAVLCGNNVGVLVDGLDGLLHFIQLVLVHEVALVQQYAVSEGDLLDGLVLDPLGLLLAEMLQDMLRINDRDDAVEMIAAQHILLHKEGLRHWCGVSQTCCLDDDAVEAGHPVLELL